MKLDIYQIDAFSSKVFGGNPAAVIPLQSWLPDDVMLKIAMENNLSETAFFVREGEAFHLRWFTPAAEVDLCGHATLAAAFIIFERLNYHGETITFTTRSGDLYIHKTARGLMMNLPAWDITKHNTPESIYRGLGIAPKEFYIGHDCLAVMESAEDIRNLKPDFHALKQFETRGVIVTAKGDGEHDFISRAFFPRLNIDEDPVTGSAHCILTPYWAHKLGKTTLKAYQASKRGGDLLCELKGDRVEITGDAVMYMKGKIYV